MSVATGTQLGPYEIQSPIGAGGMSEVYCAHDIRLDRVVAIKILPVFLFLASRRGTAYEYLYFQVLSEAYVVKELK